MQRSYTTALVAALITVSAGPAIAADAFAAPTREQTKAELAEARRTGDVVDPESGLKLNQAFPARYPAQPVAQTKTREQVQAELAEAIRTGDIVDPETQQKLNQLFPHRYPKSSATQAQTRDDSKAALADARVQRR